MTGRISKFPLPIVCNMRMRELTMSRLPFPVCLKSALCEMGLLVDCWLCWLTRVRGFSMF